MAKYYCRSGTFELIMDAPEMDVCVYKFVSIVLGDDISLDKFNNSGCSFLMSIGEKGFENKSSTKYMSLIPYLKEMGVDLPSDEDLIFWISQQMGIALNQKTINWFIDGVESDERN